MELDWIIVIFQQGDRLCLEIYSCFLYLFFFLQVYSYVINFFLLLITFFFQQCGCLIVIVRCQNVFYKDVRSLVGFYLLAYIRLFGKYFRFYNIEIKKVVRCFFCRIFINIGFCGFNGILVCRFKVIILLILQRFFWVYKVFIRYFFSFVCMNGL